MALSADFVKNGLEDGTLVIPSHWERDWVSAVMMRRQGQDQAKLLIRGRGRRGGYRGLTPRHLEAQVATYG
ncbi:MAG TPA: hypothetical protein VJ770_14120 [Stellaceae bacterium]|nr:hypothetical protein [Stellaceae bacterium]